MPPMVLVLVRAAYDARAITQLLACRGIRQVLTCIVWRRAARGLPV